MAVADDHFRRPLERNVPAFLASHGAQRLPGDSDSAARLDDPYQLRHHHLVLTQTEQTVDLGAHA